MSTAKKIFIAFISLVYLVAFLQSGSMTPFAVMGGIIAIVLVLRYFNLRNEPRRVKDGTHEMTADKFADLIVERANSELENRLGADAPELFFREVLAKTTHPNLECRAFQVAGDVFDTIGEETGRLYLVLITLERRRASKAHVTITMQRDDSIKKLAEFQYASLRELSRMIAGPIERAMKKEASALADKQVAIPA